MRGDRRIILIIDFYIAFVRYFARNFAPAAFI
jgi:hypothetical protein